MPFQLCLFLSLLINITSNITSPSIWSYLMSMNVFLSYNYPTDGWTGPRLLIDHEFFSCLLPLHMIDNRTVLTGINQPSVISSSSNRTLSFQSCFISNMLLSEGKWDGHVLSGTPMTSLITICLPVHLFYIHFLNFLNLLSLTFLTLPILYHFFSVCLLLFGTSFKGIVHLFNNLTARLLILDLSSWDRLLLHPWSLP